MSNLAATTVAAAQPQAVLARPGFVVAARFDIIRELWDPLLDSAFPYG